jgi:Carboxypeptidase regulatory-like domain
MRRGSNIRAAWVAALVVALVAVSASAQIQTGNLYGRTVAKDGSVLPGVTVTLSGVGAPMTVVSDSDGQFRFPNLSPGTYTLKAELSGMGTATRTGIRVGIGANPDIDIVLNPSVSEAITVSAEAPLLDVRKSGTGTTVDEVVLDNVPTARDPWMILQSTPGVFVDRINTGGTQSGQQSIYISKGAPRADGTWNVDGVNITDMGATGSSPTYYDFDTFEEFQITTGGSDPRIQTAGVQMNMVTKRGTNDFSGNARYLYVPGSTSAEATVPGDATGYLITTNKVNYVRDYGGDLGGPIWRDRLWLWVARGDQKISTWQSISVGQALIIPDDTILRNKNAKVNAQPFESNSFVASYTYGDKYRNARDISPNRPFETSWKQTGPTSVYKLEDTQLFGPNFYLTGMWSKVDGGFGLYGNGGFGAEAPSLWYDDGNVAHDNFYTYFTERPQKQYRLDGSYFVDIMGLNNEFKFGYGFRDTPVASASVYPGPAFGYWDFNLPGSAECTGTATESCGFAVLFRQPTAAYSGEYTELYLGDTILLGNMTIQAGLRYDMQASGIEAINVPGNPILSTPLTLPCGAGLNCTSTGGSLATVLPGIDYPGQDRDLEWKSLSPRLGLTYALGEAKKTLLRAGYNRYVSQMGSTVSSSSPVGNSNITFWGQDLNGDHTIQRNELMKVRTVTGINLSAPTAVGSTRRIDYDMNPPTTDEFLIGFEHELFNDFSVGATFTHRVNNDLLIARFEKTQGAGDWYTQNDYQLSPPATPTTTYFGCKINPPQGQQCPVDQRLNPTTLPSPVVYTLKSGVPNPQFSVITNRPDYSQTYNGIEVTATKRMSRNWMMRINASYNDYTEDCGDESFANPTEGLPSTGIVNGANVYAGAPACIGGQFAPQSAGSGAFGNVFINSKYNANISGVYVAPFGINLGANLLYRQGYPEVYRAASGAATVASFEDIGDRRFDNVYQLDLRVAKDFRIMNLATFTVSADIFNATNQRTVLQRNGLVTAGNTAFRITEMQAPRVYRIGGKVTF